MNHYLIKALLTLRTLEYDIDFPVDVIKNLKWDVIIKSRIITIGGFTIGDRVKTMGWFSDDNTRFLLNPVLDSFLVPIHSLIMADGQAGDKSIKIKLKLSLRGMISIFGMLVFTLLALSFPVGMEGSLHFTTIGVLAIFYTIFLFFRHMKKVEEILDRRIAIASERFQNTPTK